ncbi:MAG: hypothetical protein HY052_03720 [Proteobacteria bacterium]|nr:hypothetical protein [Pseudomonadota bacterium]
MERQQIEIEYKKESGSFKAVLRVWSLDAFVALSQQSDLQDKEGESLVAALLAQAKGVISEVKPDFQRFNHLQG